MNFVGTDVTQIKLRFLLPAASVQLAAFLSFSADSLSLLFVSRLSINVTNNGFVCTEV